MRGIGKYVSDVEVKSCNPQPTDGWEPSEKPGHLKKCLKHGNCTIIIHRLILTEQERTKREKEISNTIKFLVNNKLEALDRKDLREECINQHKSGIMD